MKNVILNLILLMAACKEGQPPADSIDLSKYKLAYHYILEDSTSGNNKVLNVSDSIVPISIVHLFDQLDQRYHYKNKNQVLDSLNRLDAKRNFKSIFSQPLADNIKSNDTSHLMLFFSKVYGNQLLAEVVDNQGMSEASYERITTFNTSWIYLFEFDNEQKISRVFVVQMTYN